MNREEIKKGVADKIKDRLYKMHINRTHFSQLIDVKPPQVTKFLSGTHNFTLDTLIDIQIGLGIRLIDVGVLDISDNIPCVPCAYFKTQQIEN